MFHSFPQTVPSSEYLEDLCQYVRFDCDFLAAMESRDRALRHRHRLQLDRKHGSSAQAFRVLRRDPLSPFVQVPLQLRSQVSFQPEASAHNAWLRCQPPSSFQVGPARFGDVDGGS